MVYYDTPDLSNYAARLRDKASKFGVMLRESLRGQTSLRG